MEQQAHKGFDAVWIAGAWKAVVHGRMQKPDFKLGLMRIELREIAQNLSKQISKKGA